ncbi:MAG: hypothetical protein H6741_18865 [Alphaproteobacteria bacterium]|nr:hypothetical protein [Alphaproteobacteria bacterium]MCB9794772.1 hypothetical protein [Alphaproteobacteria bacterium]
MLLLLLLACDTRLDMQLLPVPSTWVVERSYSATGGRAGSIHERSLIKVPGYPPLEARCAPEAGELISRWDFEHLAYECPQGWVRVWLGEEAMLQSCDFLPSPALDEAPSLPEALPGMMACNELEPLLQEARLAGLLTALLVKEVATPLPLDAEGADAWIHALEGLEPGALSEVEAALLEALPDRGGAPAWRALVVLGPEALDDKAQQRALRSLAVAPSSPHRDRALAALARLQAEDAGVGAALCQALTSLGPLSAETQPLRDSLSVALARSGTSCGAMASLEIPCGPALLCEGVPCAPEALAAEISAELARDPIEGARRSEMKHIRATLAWRYARGLPPGEAMEGCGE